MIQLLTPYRLPRVNRQALLNKYPTVDWRDKQFILAHVLKITREELIANSNYSVSLWNQFQYARAVQSRKNCTPLAYILGTQPFYGLNFSVNKHTLIPRPETEQLVDIALKIINKKNIDTVIDVGTGSGAIAIAIKKHAPQVKVIATDISKQALKKAKKNADANNVKIKYLRGNLLEPVFNNNLVLNNPTLILANLPYLPKKIYNQVSTEVKKEPKSALVAGNDGLKFYNELLSQLKNIDQLNGLIFECDPVNAQSLAETVEKSLSNGATEIVKDINSLNRFVVYKKTGPENSDPASR